MPVELALLQCYPNPFNASTRVRFYLPQSGTASFALYSMEGRLVFENPGVNYENGWHEFPIQLDAASSGIYWLRLCCGKEVRVQKLTLLK
jgi:hypothetical protein